MKSFLKISFPATRGEVWELKIGCHEIKGMNDMLSDLLHLDTDFLINFLEFHISGQATVGIHCDRGCESCGYGAHQ
jgi:hypothetical protein